MTKEWKCCLQSPRWEVKKSLICSSKVCGVPAGGVTEEVLKRQETSVEKQIPAEHLGREMLSGNESIIYVYICSTNLYARQLEKIHIITFQSCK